MRTTIISLASAAALLSLSGAALAAEEGAAAGAAAGAVTGAVVGGPIGAAVGAGVGGTVGGAASGPDRNIVVEGRGCSTTTVRKENSAGESKTVRKEEC